MQPLATNRIVEKVTNSGSCIYISNLIMNDDIDTMVQLLNKKDKDMLNNQVPTPKKRGDINYVMSKFHVLWTNQCCLNYSRFLVESGGSGSARHSEEKKIRIVVHKEVS